MSHQKKPVFACLTKHPVHVESKTGARKATVHQMRAAFLNGIEWPQRSEIRIAFLKNTFNNNGERLNSNYTPEKAAFVQRIVQTHLAGLVNLTFVWDVPPEKSNVRITFVQALGAYSVLGQEAIGMPIDSPTMNLGWIDNDTDYDFKDAKGTGAVVLHEFGHCLGLIHEHSRAQSETNLHWNKPLIIEKLSGPPNNWSAKDCEEQIFNSYSIDSYNGSVYDRASIMHYIFEPDYFEPPLEIPRITKLSILDKKTIAGKYPGGTSGGSQPGNDPVPNGNDNNNGDGGSEPAKPSKALDYYKLYFVVGLIVLFLIIVLMLA